MPSGYFAISISAMRAAIAARATCPVVPMMPADNAYCRDAPHVLWMCDQIEGMDRSDSAAARKANRWIGYMFAVMESRMYWDQNWSRELSRKDVTAKNDMEAGP